MHCLWLQETLQLYIHIYLLFNYLFMPAIAIIDKNYGAQNKIAPFKWRLVNDYIFKTWWQLD